MAEHARLTGRVVRIRELILILGVSRSWVYDVMNSDSPRHLPEFPKSFKLGASSVGWYLPDVEAWLKSRMQK
jgi:prophage regulatory protein